MVDCFLQQLKCVGLSGVADGLLVTEGKLDHVTESEDG